MDEIKDTSRQDAIAALQDSLRETALRGIAHDLRIPLTAILGYTEVLRKQMDTTKEKREAYLAAIAAGVRDMERLIDQLSDMAKSREAFPIRLVPIRPALLIRTILSSWEESLRENKVTISLSLDEQILILADSGAFRRILSNLIANTVKYRISHASAVVISLEKSGSHAILSYRDDGPGISPSSLLPHIFEPGFRTPSARQTKRGDGLGLYITARLADAQKAAVSARNDNGLVMTFSFPLLGGVSC